MTWYYTFSYDQTSATNYTAIMSIWPACVASHMVLYKCAYYYYYY